MLQALVALSEVIKQITKENPDFYPIKPTGYDRFLVLSLGTGSAKNEHKYNAKKASKWGVIEWLYNGGSSPLIEVYTQGSSDMVDYYNCAAFEALGLQDNFIRIQVSFNCLPREMRYIYIYISTSNECLVGSLIPYFLFI